MRLAKKRVGVVVVDMQAPDPRFRRIPLLHTGNLVDALGMKRRGVSVQTLKDLLLFEKSKEKSMGFKDEQGAEYTLEKGSWGKARILKLGVPDEAHRRAYHRVCRLLDAAGGLGLPVALLEMQPADPLWEAEPPTNPQILRAAGGGARKFVKHEQSGCSEPEFTRFVAGNMDYAVVAGFNMAFCPRRTSEDLIAILGIGLLTSGQVLPGFTWEHEENRNALEYYRKNEKIEFCRTVDGLIAEMRKRALSG